VRYTYEKVKWYAFIDEMDKLLSRITSSECSGERFSKGNLNWAEVVELRKEKKIG